MIDDAYFFDTYAIIELMNGNPNFIKYAKSFHVLTQLNIFELYYNIVRDAGEEKANIYLKKYFEYIVPYGPTVIRDAAKFRLQYKKQNMSMTDCIGYILALRLEIKFLTGDKEFKDFKNVEFVK